MIATTNGLIRIKGVREGLLITLADGPYEAVLAALQAEITAKQAFLQGSQVILEVGQRPLNRSQLTAIQKLLAEHELTLWTILANEASTREAARQLALATRLAGSQTDLEGNTLGSTINHSRPTPAVDEPMGNALLLRETLRSGRSVHYEGHVIILGDVNPGAEVSAGGNVIVWGRCRGLVHAGAFGEETAVICALDLNPTQLRIADKIAIPPQENGRKATPEQAVIRSQQIVAEPWYPTRS